MRSVIVVLFPFVVASAASGPCEAPENLTADQHRECVRNASTAVAQPQLTVEQIEKGPDFDAADPDGSRWLYFGSADKPLCYFKPHYAFNRVKGKSLKFRCWQMNGDRRFYDRNGALVDDGEFVVRLRPNSEGENRGRLYRIDASGEAQCEL